MINRAARKPLRRFRGLLLKPRRSVRHSTGLPHAPSECPLIRLPEESTVAIAAEPLAEKKNSRPNNSSAFKVVPESRELRDRVRAEAARFAAPVDRAKAFGRDELRRMSEELLRKLGLDEQYLGF